MLAELSMLELAMLEFPMSHVSHMSHVAHVAHVSAMVAVRKMVGAICGSRSGSTSSKQSSHPAAAVVTMPMWIRITSWWITTRRRIATGRRVTGRGVPVGGRVTVLSWRVGTISSRGRVPLRRVCSMMSM